MWRFVRVALPLRLCVLALWAWPRARPMSIRLAQLPLVAKASVAQPSEARASEAPPWKSICERQPQFEARHHRQASSGGLYAEAFVLNRGVDSARLGRFGALAKTAGVRFNRCDGVDAALMDLTALLSNHNISYEPPGKPDTHQWRNMACTLAHVRLWRMLVDQPQDQRFLIFEDDSAIPATFHAVLEAALKTVPSDWDLLYLNHNRLVGAVVNKDWFTPEQKPQDLEQRRGTNALLNAYMVRPSGLKHLLAFMHPVGQGIVDDIMRQHFYEFKAYFLRVALVKQDKSQASIRR